MLETIKKEHEIRKLLGNRYHLHVVFSPKGEDIEWQLFKRYENGDNIYYSSDNKPLMTSETHSLDELYEFAKKHHKVDLYRESFKVKQTMLIILLILGIVNIFLSIDEISIITLTGDLIIIISMTADYLFWEKNWRVDMLELRENFEKARNKKS